MATRGTRQPRLVAPTHPVYTNEEREAMSYTKKGSKFYKRGYIKIPGPANVAFPDINFTQTIFSAEELTSIINTVSDAFINVQIYVEDYHYRGYDEYDPCEINVGLVFSGDMEMEADGDLLANYNSGKAKQRAYNKALKEYNTTKKARELEAREVRERKAYEKLKAKFEDES